MENDVREIRNVFYSDLEQDYRLHNEDSHLYRFTWMESAVELLKKLKKEAHFPNISTEAPQGETEAEKMGELRERLVEAMEGCAGERFRNELRQECEELQKERQNQRQGRKTKRRDLWQQLWINDAACRAGIITEADYGLWLVEYLAARDIYYRESCPIMTDETALLERLYQMAKEGLRDTENAPDYELRITEEGRFRKKKLENSLIKLAEQLENEGDSGATVSRLWRLGIWDRLWVLLERKAIHMKIKNWFQDSGFPLYKEKEERKKSREYPPPKGDRKQDFTMRLFADYFDSEDGYDFVRKDKGGVASAEGWSIDINGFCVMEVDENRLVTLVKSLEKKARISNGWNQCYIPLAVHLYSGCVFFLAGSDVYKDLYRSSRKKQLEEAKKTGKFCFDFLRLDEDALEDSGLVGGNFRLRPFFHKNVIKDVVQDYGEVLDDFKRYCKTSILEAVSEYNEDCGGIPEVFRWAFYGSGEDDFEPSPEAEAAIIKDREDWAQTQSGRLQ